MSEPSAYIVAGGKSSRMGTNKAFVRFQGRFLLDRALDLARKVAPNVLIVGPSEKFGDYAPCIADIYPDHGPLGGIHAALKHSTTELNLLLAVDTPFVRPEFLRYLIDEAAAATALATVPQVLGQYQPLCAVYRPPFAEIAENALAQGRNKIGLLLTPGITRTINEQEIAGLEFPLSMFDNLNTREDLERAHRTLTHE